MTNEELLEGNKLIAMFMGAKKMVIKNKLYLNGEPLFTIYDVPGHGSRVDDFKYHLSWDWLMPVVMRIRDMRIDDFTKKKPLMQFVARLEFVNIYKETVEFIKWHNATNSDCPKQ